MAHQYLLSLGKLSAYFILALEYSSRAFEEAGRNKFINVKYFIDGAEKNVQAVWLTS